MIRHSIIHEAQGLDGKWQHVSITPSDNGDWVRYEDALAAIEVARREGAEERQAEIVEILREAARENATHAASPDAIDADVSYAYSLVSRHLRKAAKRIEARWLTEG